MQLSAETEMRAHSAECARFGHYAKSVPPLSGRRRLIARRCVRQNDWRKPKSIWWSVTSVLEVVPPTDVSSRS